MFENIWNHVHARVIKDLGSYDTGRATDDKERQSCLASIMSRETARIGD